MGSGTQKALGEVHSVRGWNIWRNTFGKKGSKYNVTVTGAQRAFSCLQGAGRKEHRKHLAGDP